MAPGKSSEYRILPLTKDAPEAWQHIPALCDRLREFCLKYDSDANTTMLLQAYQQHFLSDTPQMLAFVLLDAGVMVGHLLVSIDVWMGCKVCSILQYEKEGTTLIPREQLRQTLEGIATWGRSQGALHFQALVRRPDLVKAFQGVYDFRSFAMILRKSLTE